MRITDDNLEYWVKRTGRAWFMPGDLIYNSSCRSCGRPSGAQSRRIRYCGYCKKRLVGEETILEETRFRKISQSPREALRGETLLSRKIKV